MVDRKEWLVGTWRIGDDSSRLVIEIGLPAGSFEVRVGDTDDGEECVVSETEWDGERLSFEAYTPSTNWRSRNALRPVSEVELEQEFTVWETWLKVRPEENLYGEIDLGDPRGP